MAEPVTGGTPTLPDPPAAGATPPGERVGAAVRWLRPKLVGADSAGSLMSRMRRRRWQILTTVFPNIEQMHVVDLGGEAEAWLGAPVTPARVTVVNIQRQPAAPDSRITIVQGDACDLPEQLRGRRFDLVYSNSLIEHVGGHVRRLQLADTISRLADWHWVQTPYRYFPIEPHWLFPGFQFLPVPARAAITRHWRLTVLHTDDRPTAVARALDVELLSRTEMRHYFPRSEILSERFCGLTKSLIAVRRPG